MNKYQLITRHEWQTNQHETQNNHYWQSSLLKSALQPPSQSEQYKPVHYYYAHEYDSVIRYCVNHPQQCIGLFATLEKLGLYHGRDLYHKDSARVTAALTIAITSQQAILLEIPQVYSSGLLSPTELRPPSLITPKANKVGYYDPQDFLRQLHADEDNWIELNVDNLPDQPFTLFNSTTDQVIYTGDLDHKGHAYVKLPLGVRHVDILFDHQKEKRAWYYDVPLQIAGGVRDATQSNLNLAFGLLQTHLLRDRFNDYTNPNQIAFEWLTNDKSLADTICGQYRSIYSNLESFSNPIELPEITQADSTTGAMVRGVSQFLTDFIPAFKAAKFIKPLGRFGKWGQGAIAGVIADVAAFEPNEERLSNLIQQFPELRNPITEYLQASPDDSAIEGRFKNAIEGLLAGALADVFVKSLRVFKYARFKSLYSNIRTKVKYQLESVSYENHGIINYLKLKEDLTRQNINNLAWSIGIDDPILANILKGDRGKLNYGVGTTTAQEANRLGRIWVGDGAQVTSKGGLISSDGTKGYRFPSQKTTPQAETGIQSNFETFIINIGKERIKTGNAHLNILE